MFVFLGQPVNPPALREFTSKCRFPFSFLFFFKFYATSCLKSSECMCVIKMAFSQFELVLGNICLGMGVVRYLECPVSSPAPSPGF